MFEAVSVAFDDDKDMLSSNGNRSKRLSYADDVVFPLYAFGVLT